MRASKYIKLPLLIDEEEMKDLLQTLGSFYIFEVGKVTSQIELSCEQFLHNHCSYLQKLKSGEEVDYPVSLAFTTDRAAVEIREVGERKLVRPLLPIVQLQPGRLSYSKESGDFQLGVLGEGISWGIQFSYPFLFQDDEGEISKVDKSFPNTELFFKLQKWVRHHTKATPFLIGERKINVPVRLGKRCFPWINHHHDLEGLSVAC